MDHLMNQVLMCQNAIVDRQLNVIRDNSPGSGKEKSSSGDKKTNLN